MLSEERWAAHFLKVDEEINDEVQHCSVKLDVVIIGLSMEKCDEIFISLKAIKLTRTKVTPFQTALVRCNYVSVRYQSVFVCDQYEMYQCVMLVPLGHHLVVHNSAIVN